MTEKLLLRTHYDPADAEYDEDFSATIIGYLGAPIGDFTCHIEAALESCCLKDLGILDDIRDKMKVHGDALAIWEGDVSWCSTDWHGDTRCDCGPEVYTEKVHLASVFDVLAFAAMSTEGVDQEMLEERGFGE